MGNVVLVFDGQTFTHPEEIGTPRPDQMQGSPMDRLAEVAGRISYDSMGKGRPSPDFHRNLRAQRHHSVLRHATLKFGYRVGDSAWPELATHLGAMLNRPGVIVTSCDDINLYFVCNLQASVEWDERVAVYDPGSPVALAVGRLVRAEFCRAAPLAAGPPFQEDAQDRLLCPDFATVEPRSDDEIYASFYLSGLSRACADELLRHSFCCAPSVESGRYVDSGRRPWVPHPLLRGEGQDLDWCRGVVRTIETHCRAAYNGLVTTLSTLRPEAGIKQCRAAARGVIGMSVSTRLIFTASLAAWKIVFAQRISEHADAEIRELAVEIRKALAARWPDRFPAE